MTSRGTVHLDGHHLQQHLAASSSRGADQLVIRGCHLSAVVVVSWEHSLTVVKQRVVSLPAVLCSTTHVTRARGADVTMSQAVKAEPVSAGERSSVVYSQCSKLGHMTVCHVFADR